MGNMRRGFTPEYKDEAVKLVINTGRPIARVARELGITEQSLGRWVNAYRARQEGGDGALNETDRAELLRLRKENSELKMDRAFLKKASLYVGDRCQEAVSSSRWRSPSKTFCRPIWPLSVASSRWAWRVGRNSMVVTKKVQDSQIDSKWQSSSTGRAQ